MSVTEQEEDSGLEKLRNKNREEETARREQKREFLLRKVRHVPDADNISSSDIKSLAETLKNKSQMSSSLLNAIMNKLLESKDNITLFLKVDGALPALLRALSGQNEEYQLMAARCICNLAMGNNKQSLQVLKASESYLMAHLSGKNRYIIEACVIALGNFSKHSTKNIELLQNQGFLPKVIHLLDEFDQDVQDSVIYALSQMIYHGYDFIEPEHLKVTAAAVSPIFRGPNSSSVAFLMYILSSYKSFNGCLPVDELCSIYTHAIVMLESCLKKGEKEALYYLRIVSNCISEESGLMAEGLLKNNLLIFKECVSGLLQSQENYLQKECLSLIGILLNHPSKNFQLFATEILNENCDVVHTVINKLNQLNNQL